MAKSMGKGSLRGPLTPPLQRQGGQGVKPRPADRIITDTSIGPRRPAGGAPRGFPSATPRPGR
jgi:hypothetical protein